MRIALSSNQYFDDNGMPLNAGRVTVTRRNSDNAVELYTVSGNEWRLASNPVTLSNDGRCPTLYFDAQIVTVKVETNSGELLDTYEAGFDVSTARTDHWVDTVQGLAEIDPMQVPTVQVHGFWQKGDSPARTYIWDEGLTTQPDGGYIRSSNVRSTGRWVLLWMDDVLPASVYGVMPGQEGNMPNLMAYPSTVGSFQIATAQTIRFTYGDYETPLDFTTSKSVMMDYGASFLKSKITCASLVADSGNEQFGDFIFTGRQPVAYLSWFRSLDTFLNCGADRLVFDSSAADMSIHATHLLAGKVLAGNGNTIKLMHDAGRSLALSNCIFENLVLDLGNMEVDLVGMRVSDRDIHCTGQVKCRECDLHCGDFANGSIYIVWARTQGISRFELEGATVPGIEGVIENEYFVNGVIAGMKVDHSCVLEDVTVMNLTTADTGTLTAHRSHIGNVYAESPDWEWVLVDCIVEGNLVLGKLIATDTVFNGGIDGFSFSKSALSLTSCTVHGLVKSPNINANDSIFPEDVWPQDNRQRIVFAFSGCTFFKDILIQAVPGEEKVDPVAVNCLLVGCKFLNGFVQVQDSQGDNVKLLAESAGVHSVVYSGCSGPNIIPDYGGSTAFISTHHTYGKKDAEYYAEIPVRIFGFGDVRPESYHVSFGVRFNHMLEMTGQYMFYWFTNEQYTDGQIKAYRTGETNYFDHVVKAVSNSSPSSDRDFTDVVHVTMSRSL